jgi:pimeloyl-ACP methyl ester carboxylesterase
MSTLILPDGRTLEHDVTGPVDGPVDAPVLAFHHGTPGAVTQFDAMAQSVAAHGMRLLTWSRAGYGASTRRPGRDVASEVADLESLLDHLGVADCVVAGWSGGGPHALACGALAPRRVRAVLCIAGVAPYGADGLDFLGGMGEDNVEEFGEALRGEDELRAWMKPAGEALAVVEPGDITSQMDSILPAVDKAALTGAFADFMAQSFHRAVGNGIDGWIDDDLAFTRPWGFEVGAITVPTYVWQGSEDLMVPFAHGQWLAANIPGVVAHLEDGEGHVSLTIGALDRMLDEIVTHL